mmetsp:Transcript_36287/g.65335  ORF Transcript_36287/g.65335 Transcript_36287/m.65335 type:complete len:1104 (-) Transcript_36287:229-3540(-)|eukprot:CAMPEP_0201944046 /NCGR_PEP_ID=MMETSP0903-20130614/52338_1 /ASSEMBLY_ACC=CAM_ASM_000552 /TAXON_ID=420261 /ORGANISM="Thalassiosira antarctica, Strain CCMP982" /LENGTH=1103 /DNA_ID=CAMNT_0048486941 /DNA_START=268 /DNA_END=3579 /DNA_ORIENTATION=-
MLPPPDSTRLVTIIAHVDHGKTTLADNLVESNGIISERLAGTLRYLDSDAEEQRRGITMKASAIGLTHLYVPPRMSQNKQNGKSGGSAASSTSSAPRNMVIHLIDSPGHVDFSAEVTTALLLCDTAILVVDAVEGLCARTHSLLREAYLHQLVPVLVINKVDRLCMEMGLDASEAYMRIRELIESINAICAAMLNSAALDDEESDNKDARDAIWNFDPIEGNNVVFASALHGWGFTIPTLARSLFKSKTVPLKPPLMRKYLFGDFKYNSETGKVLKWKSNGGSGEPMFAQYALAPLWEIYEGVSEAAVAVGMKSELFEYGTVANGTNQNKKSENAKIEATTPGMERVVSALQVGSTAPSIISPQPNNDRPLPKTPQELQQILSRIGAGSESSIVTAVLRRYRPLSDAILDAVCETGPSPAEAMLNYRTRALALQIPQSLGETDTTTSKIEEFKKIQEAVRQCNPGDDVPTVAHVCKFTTINRSSVTDPDLPSLPPDADPLSANMIMGIARVLSGILRTEDVEYYMYGPRYNWSDADIPKQRIRCYLLMGSSFVRVNSVPAGHICAIYNLEALQLKTVTICDRRECMPLHGFDFALQPLVKVNVEPVSASDTETLERGLLKLSLADSSVEVTATAKGERILACLGEIHLEQSILDLETVYCDNHIKLRISDPITSFCETTDWFENEGDFDKFLEEKSPPLRQTTIPPYCDEEGLAYAKRGRCRIILSGRGAALSLRAIPLPRSVYECLRMKKQVDGSEDDLITVGKALRCGSDEASLTAPMVLEALLDSLDDFDGNGNALLQSSALSKGYSVKAVQSTNGEVYVPQKEDNKKDEDNNASVIEGLGEYQTTQQFLRGGLVCTGAALEKNESTSADAVALQKWRQDMRGSALAGFQLAMRAGPLCEEPVRGVAVILESVELAVTKGCKVAKDLSGGMVVAALRSGIRCALLTRPARLVEGHLKLTLHSSLAGLGSLHAVLSKRRGKVITDEMVDGTDLIQVTATIPQVESFGLAPELMKKSSGEVTAPELVFLHWAVLDEDPFWIPTTEEEREDYGQNLQTGDSSTGLDNNALKYIRMVRSRKGLMVDSSKIVVAAEKQRTLSRKK